MSEYGINPLMFLCDCVSQQKQKILYRTVSKTLCNTAESKQSWFTAVYSKHKTYLIIHATNCLLNYFLILHTTYTEETLILSQTCLKNSSMQLTCIFSDYVMQGHHFDRLHAARYIAVTQSYMFV